MYQDNTLDKEKFLSDYGISEKSVLYKQQIAKDGIEMANIEKSGTDINFAKSPKWNTLCYG